MKVVVVYTLYITKEPSPPIRDAFLAQALAHAVVE